MITSLLVAGLFMVTTPGAANTEEALNAVRELYEYSTQSTQVEPAQVQKMLSQIEVHLTSPEGETARVFEALASEARKDQPDGRELRVHARELYRELASDQA